MTMNMTIRVDAVLSPGTSISGDEADAPLRTYSQAALEDIKFHIGKLADLAEKRCDASYDVYVRILSESVDRFLTGLPEDIVAAVIAYAHEMYDYAYPEELREMKQLQQFSGKCRHGWNPLTCPAGCYR